MFVRVAIDYRDEVQATHACIARPRRPPREEMSEPSGQAQSIVERPPRALEYGGDIALAELQPTEERGGDHDQHGDREREPEHVEEWRRSEERSDHRER